MASQASSSSVCTQHTTQWMEYSTSSAGSLFFITWISVQFSLTPTIGTSNRAARCCSGNP